MNTPPAGWYADQDGVARFWTGEQWAPPPPVAPIQIAPDKDWGQRHPFLTALAAFWAMCLLWQWPWLAPTLLIIAAVTGAIWWRHRHDQRLAAAADRQNELALNGDPRGVFGDDL